MILVVAATQFEMNPLTRLLTAGAGIGAGDVAESVFRTLITGVGPVETTLRLTRGLECLARVDWVLNFGVAGAYVSQTPGSTGEAALLDLCLAEREWLGDLGICYGERIEALDEQLTGPIGFSLDHSLLSRAAAILTRHGQRVRRGNFVTVSAASATRARGQMLAARFDGLCENMEGAAVARVCAEFSLPMLELRAVSNLVEDRDTSRWQMTAACERAATTAALLVREMEGA